jgi:CBS-domain-containing membrane protein
MHELTAADLMSCDVFNVPGCMSLRAAAQMLISARVSGAPVVDEVGRCIGVLSTTDFVKLAGECCKASSHSAPVSCDWQVSELEGISADSVQAHMTADPVTVPRDMLLGDLAQRMLDVHIHRVIVVDEPGRPVGIVSTTDILAAVARFAREEAMSA